MIRIEDSNKRATAYIFKDVRDVSYIFKDVRDIGDEAFRINSSSEHFAIVEYNFGAERKNFGFIIPKDLFNSLFIDCTIFEQREFDIIESIIQGELTWR